MRSKLKTPNNIRFNDLIKFMYAKYYLDTPESLLDNSNLFYNSWFTGFTEFDGHFGIKYIEKKLNHLLVKDLLMKVLLLDLYWISIYLINWHLLLLNLLW